MRSYSKSMRTAFGLISVFLILVLALAACGGGSGDDDDADSSAGGEIQTQRDDGSNASGGAEAPSGGDDDTYSYEESEADSAAPLAGAGTANYVANQIPYDQLIIRTVSITLTVESVSDGASWVRELARRMEGSVFSSNTYVRDESEFAQMTIRVPSNALDTTVRELREHELVVQVDSEETSSQDVSQEYVDNESRLEALEETQRRFLALLSEADSVEEILRIESELTEIRSQIETIKGRQNYLDQMTSMSTITITMHAEDDAFEEEEGDGFMARVFGDSWDSASGVIEGILAGTITLGLIGLVLLPIVVVAYFLGRLAYRRAVGSQANPFIVTKPSNEPDVEPAN